MPKLKRGRKPVGRQRKKTTKSAETSKQSIASTLVSTGPDSLTVLAKQQLQCDFIGDLVDCCCILHSVEPQPTSINKHFPGEGDEHYLNVGCHASKLRRLYLNDPEEEDDDVPGEADEHYFIVGYTAQKYDPEEDVDVLKAQHLTATFNSLRHDIEQREHELTQINFSVLKCTENIHICQFYEHGTEVLIKLSVTINAKLEPHIHVHGKQLPRSHNIFLNRTNIFTSDGIFKLLASVCQLSVCSGNADEEFVKQFGERSTKKAYFESYVGAAYHASIRSTSCEFLTSGALRCKNCSTYRSTLRSRKLRPPNQRVKNFSSKPNSSMSHHELNLKAKQLQSENKALKARLHREIAKNSHEFSQAESREINTIVQEGSSEVQRLFPDPNSFQRLFWEEQIKYSKLSNKCGMRWHPLIIKWALLIKSKSSKAYETMRGLNFVNLPSERTLFDYSHCIPSKTGFVPEAINMLKQECQLKGVFKEDWKTYVGILQDEIKIREDLVYNPASGELIGFVNLDETSNQIMDLKNGLQKQQRELASSVLVIMVRGATTGLKFPLAAFATNRLDSTQLYNVIWETISILEIDVGLKVLFVTCDGAGQNRKFFEMHKAANGNGDVVNSVPNPFSEDERSIYFISDVPHLIKTARNCMANSGSHRNSRKLWNAGKDILWIHVVNLYKEHIEPYLYVKCHKLTRQHVNLTSFSQMKVNTAAQVLSATVAKELKDKYGDRVAGTVEFIEHMNHFFDCLNTRNLYEATNERNANIAPFTDVSDERLQYLETDFLKYFDDWKTSVENRQGKFTAAEKAGMQLSQQTLNGFKISIHSIVACVRLLLQKGAPFVLTEVFNQDPLEQHFGHYRHKGGACDAPTVANVSHTMTSLRLVGSSAVAPKRGNTKSLKRRSSGPLFSDAKIPRRKVKRLSLQ